MGKKSQQLGSVYWTRSTRKLGTRELLERKRRLLFINKTQYHSNTFYKKQVDKQLYLLSGLNHSKKATSSSQKQDKPKKKMKKMYKESEKVTQMLEPVKFVQPKSKMDPYLYAVSRWAVKNVNSYLKLLTSKRCLICREVKSHEHTKIILCTICDDAYHRDCLQKPLTIQQVRLMRQWLCPACDEKASDGEPSQTSHASYHYLDPTIFNNDYGLFTTMALNVALVRKYCVLTDLGKQQWTRRQNQCFNMKPFVPMQEQQLYWKPLLYALSTTKHYYCPCQVYKNKETLKLNNSKVHIPQTAERLSPGDEKAFQQFLQQVQNGDAPPLTVEKCPIKGFLIRSVRRIQPKSILCEYAGQVMTFRQSLSLDQNNSIFALLQTGQSSTTLQIVPSQFCNISKYFLGINNSDIRNHLKINVQSMVFSYKGRNRIIFYSSREIKAGQLLYINYNGGIGAYYPTEDFK